MHVVKLGGSLLDSPDYLHLWLRCVAAGGGRVVVVPGGGPFADAVRAAEGKLGFDDRAAHRMALLAMEQCGWLFVSLEPALVPSDSMSAIRRALHRGRVPVWMPFRDAADAEGIPASWDVTSDSLAAWLARELGASALWLVKACEIPDQDPARLAAGGIVDAAFPGYCIDAPFQLRVLGPGESQHLAAAIAAEPATARGAPSP
jgi:dihydroneopterin aldolase